MIMAPRRWRSKEQYDIGHIVTSRIRCARCLPVIRHHCHVICLRVVFYHVIMCISFCIRVRLMHPSIFPVVRFAFRRSILLRWSFLPFFRVRVLNISGLDRDLPSGLGLLPVDRLSSFVSFGLRLILQRLTEGPKRPRVCCSPTPPKFGPKPTKLCSMS